MKQILQSAKSGELELVELPAPTPAAGQVLVRTHWSVVSPGTETMAMDFARKSLLGKARSRPDLVKQVVRKLQHEGPLQTYQAVMGRLEAPQPLGYSCSGVVEAVGEGVRAFRPGDRVACAGAGYANHAEWNVVPENLVALVPESVGLEQAAYATVGAISLQGIRLVSPQLGEVAAVVGLGLIGQLALQLLRANGCRVLGLDTAPVRVKQALGLGAEWAMAPDDAGEEWKRSATGGHGIDFSIIAASAPSSAPIALAAELSRHKARMSVVGLMPMDLDRRVFFEKELGLQVSMSYGPGRYDRRYEEEGYDYPLPFVRWTENRNLQAFLALLASGSVDPGALDTEVVPFADAKSTYEALAKGQRKALSMTFRYAAADGEEKGREASLSLDAGAKPRPRTGADVAVAFIGAGNYAKNVLLPALGKDQGVRRAAVAATTGPSSLRTAERYAFERCTTDVDEVLGDESIDLVFVTTRHDSHASLAARALEAGKCVWLEKPVGLSAEEVTTAISAARNSAGWLTVGYNRRCSAHTALVREAFANRHGPLALHYVVAAGAPPAGTWITDPAVGGGRIVGEVCHFVDLARSVVGRPIRRVTARALGARSAARRFRGGAARVRRRLTGDDRVSGARGARIAEGALRGFGRRANGALRQLPHDDDQRREALQDAQSGQGTSGRRGRGARGAALGHRIAPSAGRDRGGLGRLLRDRTLDRSRRPGRPLSFRVHATPVGRWSRGPSVFPSSPLRRRPAPADPPSAPS